MADFDPYKVLKVDPSADAEIITAAYKALSKKYHPDLNKSPNAVTQMQEINRAYDALKDPTERAKVDAQLAKQRSANTNTYGNSNYSPSTSSNYRPNYDASRNAPPPPPPPSNQNPAANNPFQGFGDSIKKAWETVTKPGEVNSDVYFLYQKRLVDDSQNKIMRVSTYQDRLNGKVCNIYASAPDAKGRIQTGSAFLQSLETFDLLEAIGEALHAISDPISPIEMNTDHDTFYRKIIRGLNGTFVGLEVLKYTRGEGKICLLSIGERRNETNGVASPQSQKQLIQLQRIIEEAFNSIAPKR